MSNEYATVNDIFLKFIEPKVYDPKAQNEHYVKTKDEFAKYTQSKQLQTKKPPKVTPNISNNPVYVRTRTKFLSINSKDRDKTVYPFPSRYTLNVGGQNFTNVIKIELWSTKFINIRQLVRDTPVSIKNNLIVWQMEDDIVDGKYVIYEAEISPGNYTPDELGEEIAAKMMAVERQNPDGKDFYFDVTIDNLLDTALISSLKFTRLDNPITQIYPLTYQIAFPNHGFTLGQEIFLYNAVIDPTIIPAVFMRFINTVHTITNVVDADTFEFETPFILTGVIGSTPDLGGNNVKIAPLDNFRLLFSIPLSINDVLDFPTEDTDFGSLQYNAPVVGALDVFRVLPGDLNTSIIETFTAHGLTTGDRIVLYSESNIPVTIEQITPFRHDYNLDPVTITVPHMAADEALRVQFVNDMTDPTGLYVTVIDETHLSVNVIYRNYNTTYFDDDDGHRLTIVEVVLTFDHSPTDKYGSISIRNTNIDLFGEQQFYMCSSLIGGDFRNDNNDVINIFAKIYLAGDPYDTVFNSFVGGKKTFYNNAAINLEDLDISFIYSDGSYVDFLDHDHSFVLKITEVVPKIESSEFNSKIGFSEFNAQHLLINPGNVHIENLTK